MRLYTPETVFTFGKYCGQSVQDVAAEDWGYLDFCLLRLDHFAMRITTGSLLCQLYPTFGLTEEGWKKMKQKEEAFDAAAKAVEESYDHYDHYDSSYSRSEEREEQRRDTFYAMTDGQYGDYEDY